MLIRLERHTVGFVYVNPMLVSHVKEGNEVGASFKWSKIYFGADWRNSISIRGAAEDVVTTINYYLNGGQPAP